MAIIGVTNATYIALHKVRPSGLYYAFFAVRLTAWLLLLLSFLAVFGRSNDPFVLRTLARSAPVLVLGAKLAAFLGLSLRYYLVLVLFDELDWLRFLMDPCTYVIGVGLIVLCDANRRAQKLRWAYYGICLVVSAFNALKRFTVVYPAEQVVLIYTSAASLRVQARSTHRVSFPIPPPHSFAPPSLGGARLASSHEVRSLASCSTGGAPHHRRGTSAHAGAELRRHPQAPRHRHLRPLPLHAPPAAHPPRQGLPTHYEARAR